MNNPIFFQHNQMAKLIATPLYKNLYQKKPSKILGGLIYKKWIKLILN